MVLAQAQLHQALEVRIVQATPPGVAGDLARHALFVALVVRGEPGLLGGRQDQEKERGEEDAHELTSRGARPAQRLSTRDASASSLTRPPSAPTM